MDAHQISIYTAVLLTAFIIGAILLYFVFSLIRHQRRNALLYKEKILAEITTLENERSRVANDLHDELGPLLSAVKFKLSSIEPSLPEDEETLQQTNNHIADIIQRMREISNDLMPSTLSRKGLVFAIEELIYKLEGPKKKGLGSSLEIRFTHQNIPVLPKDTATNIYRVVHEIIHNTIKHAKASILTINLDFNQTMLILKSEDNGVGFNYKKAAKEKSGLGLRSLVSRTEVMGGYIYIESKEGKGTIYTIEIPLTG